MFDELARRTGHRSEATFAISPRFHDCPGGRAAEAADESMRSTEAAIAQARQLTIKLDDGKYAQYRFSRWDAGRSQAAADVARITQDYVTASVAGKTKRWLWMHGPYGTGKTHLAVAATRQIAAQALRKPLAAVWPQHCSLVKESWSDDDGDTEAQLWGVMRSAGILLLDDVDKIDTTDWAIQKLYEVIDYRVVHQRQTIITANHSLKQLRQIWGRSKREHIRDTGLAILSRIEGELFAIVEFSGADQRGIDQ